MQKSERSLYSYKVGRLLWSLGGEICGERGGNYIRRGGNAI